MMKQIKFVFCYLLISTFTILISCEKSLDANQTTNNTSTSKLIPLYNIRVLTFNVLSPCWAHPSYYPASTAPLLDRVSRRSAIINFLRSQQNTVDVIALQEVAQVEFNYFRDALQDVYYAFQANHSNTYWSSWITPTPPWELNGNAIFVKKSRFSNVAFENFTASNDGNHAALFTAVLRNSGGKMVRGASVHLDSDYPYNRDAEINAVLNRWSLQANTCDIIAGDFNTETDATNIKTNINRVGYLDILHELGVEKQTHPWDTKYNGADNWGIIDHIISRNSSCVDGQVFDFNLYQQYPNAEEMRINTNLRLCGSDHFPVSGSIAF